jgi:spore cortex biosynthesis protein YabQ
MLAMLISGLSMGIVFDGYRVVAHQLHFPKWTKPVLDVCYWMIAVCFIFRMLYITNQGEMRFYVFIGLFIGVWFYFLWFSFTTIRVVVILMKIIKQIVRFLIRSIEILILKPLLGLYKLVRVLLRFLLWFAMFIGRIVLQLLSPFWKLLVFLTRPIWRHFRMPAWVARSIQQVNVIWNRLFKREK